MGMMMLNPYLSGSRLVNCVLGAEIIRVEIIGDHLGIDFKNRLQVIDGPFKGLEGLQVLQISHVLAEKGILVLPQTDGAGEKRPARQGRSDGPIEGDWHGDVPPGPADHSYLFAHNPHDRVIISKIDIPIVNQEVIRNTGEAPERLPVIYGYRFLTDIATRHNQCEKPLLQDQGVERGVGKHHPETAVPRGHLGSDGFPLLLSEKDNRALGGLQELSFQGTYVGKLSNFPDAGRHEGQGFFLPVFSLPEAFDRFFIGCIHGQMKSPEAFDGQDFPRFEKMCGS